MPCRGPTRGFGAGSGTAFPGRALSSCPLTAAGVIVPDQLVMAPVQVAGAGWGSSPPPAEAQRAAQSFPSRKLNLYPLLSFVCILKLLARHFCFE